MNIDLHPNDCLVIMKGLKLLPLGEAIGIALRLEAGYTADMAKQHPESVPVDSIPVESTPQKTEA